MDTIEEKAERERQAAEYLRDKIHYDPLSGRMLWKFRHGTDGRWNRRYCGMDVGSVCAEGYIVIVIKIEGRNRPIRAHRLAWFMVYGELPGTIDHINGDRIDNRMANLRNVTVAENNHNKARYSNNRSGEPGVHWHKQRQKWCASVRNQGKSNHLGLFDDFDAAVVVARQFRFQAGHKIRNHHE